MTTYEGQLQGAGVRVALVCSRFNLTITERLLAGALDGLRGHGVDDDSVTVAWVPGAFELPLAAARLAKSGEYDAIVCLGAVIRGATGHYEQVATQCAAGLQRAQLDTGVPVIFGVLTTDTLDQALERAAATTGGAPTDYARTEHTEHTEPAPAANTGETPTGDPARPDHTEPAPAAGPAGATASPPVSNKGFEAALAALEMADLLRQLPKTTQG